MTPKPPFEDQLDDWIEDGPTVAPGQLLDTVLAAFPSIPQRRGALRIPWRTSPMSGFARLLAVLVIAVGLGTAAVLVALRPTSTGVGSPGSPSPAAVVVASPTPSASPAATPTTAPTAPPTTAPTPAPTTAPTPATPTVSPCDPTRLVARITLWEGAAGHRTADIELTNTASSPCTVQAMARPQLVDGNGAVLIDGAAPGASRVLTIAPGGILKTLAQDGNYCGPAPTAPVSVAFVLASGGRIVATPFSPTDATVPPCNGPGLPADISMQPWAP